MKILTLSDFNRINIGHYYYFSYVEDEIEICLERCLNGFDIAVYDKAAKFLLLEKRCTNLSNERSYLESLAAAIAIANEMYLEIKDVLIKVNDIMHYETNI
jgi:hypothetical protein